MLDLHVQFVLLFLFSSLNKTMPCNPFNQNQQKIHQKKKRHPSTHPPLQAVPSNCAYQGGISVLLMAFLEAQKIM